MIYLLYGTINFLIDQELKKILTKNNINEIDITKYDLEVESFKNIIEDASTMSLFGDKKAIIVNNAFIFSASTKTKETKEDPTIFENYFNNINPNTILIFILNSEKLDERKKLVKNIRKIGIVKDFNESNNLTDIVKKLMEDYKISFSDINLLIDRVGKDIYQLNNEIDKLKIYKIDTKTITTEDIINLTTKTIDTDIFELIEAIISDDKTKAITIYNEMLKLNEEPIKIIIMLANQFRIMYQSKELSKKGHTEGDIASILGIHPYRVKLALNKGRSYSNETLLKFIDDLADMDYNIKNGLVDKDLALELFILKK